MMGFQIIIRLAKFDTMFKKSLINAFDYRPEKEVGLKILKIRNTTDNFIWEPALWTSTELEKFLEFLTSIHFLILTTIRVLFKAIKQEYLVFKLHLIRWFSQWR